LYFLVVFLFGLPAILDKLLEYAGSSKTGPQNPIYAVIRPLLPYLIVFTLYFIINLIGSHSFIPARVLWTIFNHMLSLAPFKMYAGVQGISGYMWPGNWLWLSKYKPGWFSTDIGAANEIIGPSIQQLGERADIRMGEGYDRMTKGHDYGSGTDFDWAKARGKKNPLAATDVRGKDYGVFELKKATEKQLYEQGTQIPLVDATYKCMRGMRAWLALCGSLFYVYSGVTSVINDEIYDASDLNKELEKRMDALHNEESKYDFTLDKLNTLYESIVGKDSDLPPDVKKFIKIMNDLRDSREKITSAMSQAKKNIQSEVQTILSQMSMQQKDELQKAALEVQREIGLKNAQATREAAEIGAAATREAAETQASAFLQGAQLQAEATRDGRMESKASGVTQAQAQAQAQEEPTSRTLQPTSHLPETGALPKNLKRAIKNTQASTIASELLNAGIDISSIRTELDEKGIYYDVESQLNQLKQNSAPAPAQREGEQQGLRHRKQFQQPHSGGKKTKRSKKQKKGKRTRRNK
jgi:hypothetical protein